MVEPTNKTRKEVLEYVLKTIEIPESVSFVLDDLGIKSIPILINVNEKALMEHEEIPLANVTAIVLFAQWLKVYTENHKGKPPTNWETEFTEDIWDQFVLQRGLDNTSSFTSKSSSSNKSSENEIELVEVPTVPQVKTVNESKPEAKVSFDMPAIKIDVKSYPEFDGQLKNWKSFKQKFKSVASLHKIGYLLNKDYVIPTDPDDLSKYQQHNSFLQSILEYALAKGNALTKVKKFSDAQDGMASWSELVLWFENQGSIETQARKALTIINTHRLTANSFGGAELYLEKFESALQDLEEVGKPYDMAMAKINFLNNIQDEDYKIVKESLEMDDSKTYHECLVEIRRKSISVENTRNRQGNSRKTNNSNSSNSNEKKNSKANTLRKKMGEFWVEPSKWKKMSKKEKDDHIKKAREARRNKSSGDTNQSNNSPLVYLHNIHHR